MYLRRGSSAWTKNLGTKKPTKRDEVAELQRPGQVRHDEQGAYVIDDAGVRHDFGADDAAALAYAKDLFYHRHPRS